MTTIITDPTNRVLMRMSTPISLGMLSTFLFQVVDTYFIGKLGPTALAALSFSSTLYFILMSLFIGMSIGISVLVGKAYGAKRAKEVKQLNAVSFVLTLGVSVGLSVLISWNIRPIFTILGATAEVMHLIEAYIRPLLWGIPFIATGLTMSSILRSTGTITAPEVIMAFAGVINLVLDYALIFGNWHFPELGIQGGAYATVVSWVFIFMGMVFLWWKSSLIALSQVQWRRSMETVSAIFSMAIPTIATQMVGPLTITFITFLLAKQSQESVAAFGVASRIETLALIGVLGISTAITPFIAQNMGANLKQRIDEAIVFAGKASLYLGVAIAAVLVIFISPIAGIFTDDLFVIRDTTAYFYIVSISYMFYAFFVMTTSIYNGLQQTIKSLQITAIRAIVLMIPFSVFGSLYGTYGIFMGIATANVVAGIWAGIQMRKSIREMNSELAQANIVADYTADMRGVFHAVTKHF